MFRYIFLLCLTGYVLSYQDICTNCLLDTTKLMMEYGCKIGQTDIIECITFNHNDLSAFICGSLNQKGIIEYINSQCFNQISNVILARNMAVGICHQFCYSSSK
jgi:hypothetical protein